MRAVSSECRLRSVLLWLMIVLSLSGAAPTAETTADNASAHEEARAVLQRWIAAQNSGDFASYAALYSERFHGIRRTPTRTVPFDRTGWLRDRRRMFQKKIEISADHVVIAPRSGTSEIQLTQTFRSGGYADVGQKQVVLAPERGGLRIIAEEMLESQALPAPPPVPWSIGAAQRPAAPRVRTETENQVKELMRRFRSGVRRGDLVSLRRLLPASGHLDIEITECIGECRKIEEKKSSWTRSTLVMEAFADLDVNKDLPDECLDDTDCVQSMNEETCRSGCGGYLGEFWWRRSGGAFSLAAIRYTYD